MYQSDGSHIHDTKLLLLGMTLGAGLAALFAPRSGADTRKHLRAKLHQSTEQLEETATSFAEESKVRLEEARDDINAPDRLAKRDSLEEGLGE